MKLEKSINKEKLFTIINLLIVSFIFTLNASAHPLIGQDSATDSSVYRLMGMMIEKGYMPYVDIFDHKGPIIYIVNYFGRIINVNWGIWIFEWVSLTISLLYMLKISMLIVDKKTSYISTIISLIPLLCFFERGNFVEEYAMPFISISLYIFLDYFINNNITKARLMVFGFCFASVFLSRVNMASLWVVCCIAVLIRCLINKDYKSLITFILFFCIGILIIALPLIVWLIKNNALQECINDSILFNLSYVSGENIWLLRIKSFSGYFFTASVILSVFICLINTSNNKMLYITYLILLLFTLFCIGVGGRTHGHYAMIIVPMFTFPFSLFIERYKLLSNTKQLFILILILLVFNYHTFNSYYEIAKRFGIKILNWKNEVTETVVNYVDNNTDENDKISIYGNWSLIYLRTNRVPSTKYAFQFPVSDDKTEILDDYFKQLEDEQPKIIIVQEKYYDNRINEFLIKNQYTKMYSPRRDDVENAMIYKK